MLKKCVQLFQIHCQITNDETIKGVHISSVI